MEKEGENTHMFVFMQPYSTPDILHNMNCNPLLMGIF
jgi:hypothetical protein